MNSRLPKLVLSTLALGTTLLASAQVSTSAPAAPLWELGGVTLGAHQQAYPGADKNVARAILLPYFIYRGPILRADQDGVGLRAIRTPRFELDISAAGSFGSDADEVDARRGMPDIGTLVEFGPRLRWNLGGSRETGIWRMDLPLRGVFDLSDSLAHRGIMFQPGVSWSQRSGSTSYSVGVSALIADQRLASTFYGVAPAYATPGRPAYEAEAGLMAWRLSATAARELTRDWRVFGFARIDTVAGAANRSSPLVRQTSGASVGVGVSYTWLRSSRTAAD